MSGFVRTISLAGIAGVASANGAFAQSWDDLNDELNLSEAPLSLEELQDARGGFTIGGLEFDISVSVTPIAVTPISNLLGDDGVFGDGGVLGQGGPLNSSGAQGETNNSAGVIPSSNASAPTQSLSQKPNSASETTPSSGQSASLNETTGPSMSFSVSEMPDNLTAMQPNGNTLLIENTLNDVVISRNINAVVHVWNVEAVSGMSVAGALTAGIMSNHAFLSPLN
jgi:hypothetical protein